MRKTLPPPRKRDLFATDGHQTDQRRNDQHSPSGLSEPVVAKEDSTDDNKMGSSTAANSISVHNISKFTISTCQAADTPLPAWNQLDRPTQERITQRANGIYAQKVVKWQQKQLDRTKRTEWKTGSRLWLHTKSVDGSKGGWMMAEIGDMQPAGPKFNFTVSFLMGGSIQKMAFESRHDRFLAPFPFDVGQKVEAFYGRDKKWYPAEVTTVNKDFSFGLKFGNGFTIASHPKHSIRVPRHALPKVTQRVTKDLWGPSILAARREAAMMRQQSPSVSSVGLRGSKSKLADTKPDEGQLEEQKREDHKLHKLEKQRLSDSDPDSDRSGGGEGRETNQSPFKQKGTSTSHRENVTGVSGIGSRNQG